MTLLHKLGVAALVLALVGGGFWYMQSRIAAQAQVIGRLEGEKAQLAQSLKDSQASAQAVRQQLEMWQWLYADLQEGFDEVRRERAQMSRRLAELKKEVAVEEYLDCPMPDSLYQWVREN